MLQESRGNATRGSESRGIATIFGELFASGLVERSRVNNHNAAKAPPKRLE